MFEELSWIKDFITLRDILDIFLVSLVFYLILRLIVRYRGIKILLGLLGLFFLWLVALVFKLSALGWLLSQFWSISLFAVIVIFQPEIRRALQSFSTSGGILSQRYSKAKVVKKIIKAVSYMSEKQIGALVVFERNIPVHNFCEGCVKIDGLVSPELLITIFYPLTPLHDGAVVIKGNKILYAACVLPLAKDIPFDSKLGTRHRAALGITQETDAVAVVVSEETGAISVAVGGKLYRDLSENELKEILYKELGINEDS
ncbi:MAG: TIGR00159 family protein [Aquificae bacterium]|jgi:uncharacterized protein (TIGR00159 family)|nr:TIGR00159 family protein [Aquificota bacterium]